MEYTFGGAMAGQGQDWGGAWRPVQAPLIADIRRKADQRQAISVVKIAREQNKIAHELAKVSCRLGQSRVSFSSVLVWIPDDECVRSSSDLI